MDGTSILAGVDCLPTVCRLAGAKIEPKEAAGLVGEDVANAWLGKALDLFWWTETLPINYVGSDKDD